MVFTRRTSRRRFIIATLLGLLVLPLSGQRAPDAASPLPKQLSDRAFWQMIVDFSEPGGVFPSDNFMSNERNYQEVIPELKTLASPNGVYLGVGPDQNFTYIAALRPRMAFIVDIRRQNLVEHLLYKALIEMSDDRAAFVSRLFSRPQPAGLSRSSEAGEIFEAYSRVDRSDTLFAENLRKVMDRLVKQHGFALTQEDRQSLEYIYYAFFQEGPDLRYSFPRRTGVSRYFPTYADLMIATDRAGVNHGYLANEQNFLTLKDFERRNLLVPLVGDFGGDKAIRAVGRYLKEHGATVDAFYTSNVEQYLFQGEAWQRYYASVATLPLGVNSRFIRAYFDAGYFYPPGIITPDLHSVQLLDPVLELLNAVGADQVHNYLDLVRR